MKLNDYQVKALSTAIYPREHAVIYPALGLSGEAGEVADKVKKILRGDSALTNEKRLEIAKELGDVLWYIATLSDDLGYTMQEIAQLNLMKLSSRKERGQLKGSGDNR